MFSHIDMKMVIIQKFLDIDYKNMGSIYARSLLY